MPAPSLRHRGHDDNLRQLRRQSRCSIRSQERVHEGDSMPKVPGRRQVRPPSSATRGSGCRRPDAARRELPAAIATATSSPGERTGAGARVRVPGRELVLPARHPARSLERVHGRAPASQVGAPETITVLVKNHTISPRFEVFNLTNNATINGWISQVGPTVTRRTAFSAGGSSRWNYHLISSVPPGLARALGSLSLSWEPRNLRC
jgi:hypothetical protein